MTKKNFGSIAAILCVITWFSCTHRGQEHPVTSRLMASPSLQIKQDSAPTVIHHDEAEILLFEDFNTKIKNIHYIPFFSKKPIGNVDRLIIFDRYVIVLDAYKSESIFIFDISGKLIHVIKSKGGGPQEYHGLSDISINREEAHIVINDRMAPYMLYFTLDGQFVKKAKSTPCSYFEVFNNKIIHILSFAQSYSHDIRENYHVGVAINDSILYKGFPFYPLQVQAVDCRGLYYNHKDELLFRPNLCDSIYQFVNDSTVYVKYVVAQKKNIWKKREENLSAAEYHAMVKESNYTYLQPPVLETEQFLAYNINSGLMGRVASTVFWYDKNKKQSLTFRGYKNPLHHPNCVPRPLTVWGNYYAGVFLPDDIESMSKLKKAPEFTFGNEELNHILENDITEDLEFILVMYELQ